MQPIVLASESPYRRELLARLGVSFECASPHLDEDSTKKQISDSLALAKTLARLKAQKILANFPNHLVIGADQVLDLEGVIFPNRAHLKERPSNSKHFREKPTN